MALTTRVYPSGGALDAVELLSLGGAGIVERLEGWRLQGIWWRPSATARVLVTARVRFRRPGVERRAGPLGLDR